jgi:hypothetical protein
VNVRIPPIRRDRNADRAIVRNGVHPCQPDRLFARPRPPWRGDNEQQAWQGQGRAQTPSYRRCRLGKECTSMHRPARTYRSRG